MKDFRNLIEIENIHTIVQLLKDDCGISFLYKAAVEKELKEGTLIQIPLSDFMVMHVSLFCGIKTVSFLKNMKLFSKNCKVNFQPDSHHTKRALLQKDATLSYVLSQRFPYC